jgi:hypothetical protein
MNARERIGLVARDECIEAMYAREVVDHPANLKRRLAIDERQASRMNLRTRSEHLERSRSMDAPTLLREVPLFI